MAQPVWNTAAGSIGTCPSGEAMTFQLSARPILPAVNISYRMISGSLPAGLQMDDEGLIFGFIEPVNTNMSYQFVVRAIDNFQNIRDRTFGITISGATVPGFNTLPGSLLVTQDSIWVELPIQYTSADPNTIITLAQGQLPPGLEINEFGVIRGYPSPPVLDVNLPGTTGTAVATDNNQVVCYSTTGFEVGRPIIFSGTSIGGIQPNKTYYIKSVIDSTRITISNTVSGDPILLNDDTGFMGIVVPGIVVGQPTIKTYDFTLKLNSVFGEAVAPYSITVVNQNTPTSAGGPGKTRNTRKPTIYNTRPKNYDISADDVNYRYYLLPPDGKGMTYPPTTAANIGSITSDNIFSFRILGHDFDSDNLVYSYANLPLGLVGDPTTGWITGNPIIERGLNIFSFSVFVSKQSNPTIVSDTFLMTFKITNELNGDITWVTPEDLGTILNGSVSELYVKANSDVDLKYKVVSGVLPPNLSLLPEGGLIGSVAFQPNEYFTPPGSSTEFTFTISAYSEKYPVSSERTFTLTVYQEFEQPTDTLYIKCTPSVPDRMLLDSLLYNEELIPTEYLFRPEDPNFGKAAGYRLQEDESITKIPGVVYGHAYGIYASDFEQYVAAITKNHYWRQITLGEIKTAIARDQFTGDILYEVVYSEVIDNLINPEGISVSKDVYWPRRIPLNLGPWYTSETDIFTSYIGDDLTPPEYYTSLSPGYARTLHPNSLPNMRQQVGSTLGQVNNYKVLPKWMTSQQRDGSTLGYTPAWVICYTKPGYSDIIKENITTKWINVANQEVITLNTVNFAIDRFLVDKSMTYNYDNNLSPATWTTLPSATPKPDPIDSKDFYVLFPRRTILPNKTQY